MKQILLAIQFLTIIPLKTNKGVTEADIAKSAAVFIMVGFIQGLSLIATDYFSSMVFHQDLAIGLVLLILVLSNGGFHLDGLSDTFDALAVKPSGDMDKDRQRCLSVMKDASAGPIGVTAIFFSLGMKYLSLKNISHLTPHAYYSSLLLMPVVSKWTMVLSMFHGKPARQDGLGNIFLSRVGLREATISTAILILIIAILTFLTSGSSYLFYTFLITALYFLSILCVRFFTYKFGGLTGDVLGAISELTEIMFLFMVIIWSRLSI